MILNWFSIFAPLQMIANVIYIFNSNNWIWINNNSFTKKW